MVEKWCSSPFDVRKMMFQSVRCSKKWCSTHHYLASGTCHDHNLITLRLQTDSWVARCGLLSSQQINQIQSDGRLLYIFSEASRFRFYVTWGETRKSMLTWNLFWKSSFEASIVPIYVFSSKKYFSTLIQIYPSKYLSSGTYFLQAVEWGGKLTLIQWESASRHLLWNVLKMKSVIEVQAWKSFQSD